MPGTFMDNTPFYGSIAESKRKVDSARIANIDDQTQQLMEQSVQGTTPKVSDEDYVKTMRGGGGNGQDAARETQGLLAKNSSHGGPQDDAVSAAIARQSQKSYDSSSTNLDRELASNAPTQRLNAAGQNFNRVTRGSVVAQQTAAFRTAASERELQSAANNRAFRNATVGTVMGIIGTVVGGIFGGPAGAKMGAQVGNSMGGNKHAGYMGANDLGRSA